jgi:hypothetical protein
MSKWVLNISVKMSTCYNFKNQSHCFQCVFDGAINNNNNNNNNNYSSTCQFLHIAMILSKSVFIARKKWSEGLCIIGQGNPAFEKCFVKINMSISIHINIMLSLIPRKRKKIYLGIFNSKKKKKIYLGSFVHN